MDESGDLAGSISQMPDLVYLENFVTEKSAEFIRRSSHIILELDLNDHITNQVLRLAKANNKPVYGIPGNLSVIIANKDVLRGVDCFICNNIEAGRLMGRELPKEDTSFVLHELSEFVHTSGLSSMVITLGANGCVYYDASSGDAGYQSIFSAAVVDTSGAGDAFFSGTVAGLIKGYPIAEAVVFGSKVASWTIQSNENTCRDLPELMANDKLFQVLKTE